MTTATRALNDGAIGYRRACYRYPSQPGPASSYVTGSSRTDVSSAEIPGRQEASYIELTCHQLPGRSIGTDLVLRLDDGQA